METVTHDKIHVWWDGLVKIDEIKEYSDDRGSLVELWRIDDDATQCWENQSQLLSSPPPSPMMSYWSVTKPFVIRGPHQHSNQIDFFITWKGKMVYQLFNPETKEMKYFITNPDKITRVKVSPPIIHSYRNLETKDVITGNFPTSLFMGIDKKEHIDEIRHETLIQPLKNIWVLGAAGRLGKSLVDSLYKEMGYHNYNVIPIFEKFSNDREGLTKLNIVFDNIIKTRISDEDVIINCIANTQVKNENSDFIYPNFLLPKYITDFSNKHKITMIHFSTDYVFQKGEIGEYTKSKLQYEKWLETNNFDGRVKLVRLANLFSQDEKDVNNAITKLYKNSKNSELTLPKGLCIMPTDVNCLSEYLVRNYIHITKNVRLITNISGKVKNVEELLTKYTKQTNVKHLENPEVVNNPEEFLKDESYIELDCDEHITKKFNSF